MVLHKGFWKVGHKKFYNKWEALREGQRVQESPTFHFFGQLFDDCNWAIEPEKSWPYYLKRRAEQLRDNYSYIRLFYSGGSDSQTMLNTFLSNNIFVDEIICYRYCPTGQVDHIANSEVNDVAIPFLEKNRLSLGKTKITILDIFPENYQYWFSGDWMQKKAYLDFLTPDPGDIHKIFPQFMKVADKNMNICHLQGGQKPKIERRQKGFYAFYYDSNVLLDLAGEWQENFYTTEEFPEVHIKQCHLLLNLLKKEWPKIKEYERIPLTYIDRSCRDLLFKPISLGKSDGLLSAKAELLSQKIQKENSSIYNKYFDAIKDPVAMNKAWFQDDDYNKNYKAIKSAKSYFLGDFE